MKDWGKFIQINFNKIINNFVYVYLLVPILIFVFGWLKVGYAFLLTIALLLSTYRAIKQEDDLSENFEIKKSTIMFVVLILIFWLLLSGIGGVGLQSWDFHGRNAIFRDLVSHSWPVQYDYSNQPEMMEIFGSGGYFVYYFCFFLPAALIGKIFGWQGANLFLFFWCFIGLLIVVLLLFTNLKKSSIWIVFAFIFFSGMDVLGSSGRMNDITLFEKLLSDSSLEWWAVLFQYSSFTTQLFNVFNQSIPAWIITLLIIDQKHLRIILFLYSMMIFYSPFPFIGLFPIVIFKFLELIKQNKNNNIYFVKKRLIHQIANITKNREWVTFQNLVGGGILLIIGFSFLFSNVGNHAHGVIWNFHTNIISLTFIYVLFCLLEFLILGLVLFPLIEDKKKFYYVVLLLLTIPLYKYGQMNDFGMRVSIPIILWWFMIVLNTLIHVFGRNNNQFKIRKFIIILIIMIGSITPLHQISRSFFSIIDNQQTTQIKDAWKTFDYGGYIDKMDALPRYIVSKSDDPFFFKYLAKK